ncbi:hypothetical protein GE21DRAFT_10436 [Neurospora crassa]|uniref:VanZ domain-containing protein n=2 Tax=Neurospora crassa TaxID=5141 RepID=Q7S591_NEUCR|nr:VanZ domain-containing protein [Neurospora crassa OR74A]EAA30685.1 VanZ domain-containing protein [Neurospora crassa OR74A]KHE84851.1 hypothetical protein GE21DRAFT_10436 [Neurospora crassa]CAF05870.1 conserved hypothetical protein [Neurospora crassa]|eukprot:XP_959921.1 VanZ domain-containing protein [Neurospora crassa OR74A]
MRIRMPFAGIFAALLLLSAYAGLSSLHMPQGTLLNDKTLHFFVFFLLTVTFYWILDTTRRRILHLTLSVVTLGMGVGSEFVQAAIPNNGREFDPYDILANLVGSLLGLGLCGWYHKRMLERKRVRKYTAVPTGEDIPEGDVDLELGEVRRSGDHEEGVVVAAAAAASVPAAAASPAAGTATATAKNMSLEEELDNWDENAVDAWDDGDDVGDVGGSGAGGKSGDATKDAGAAKKRVD